MAATRASTTSACGRPRRTSAGRCLAAVGLTLAAIGLYGVLACLVGERTREIGVRVALGATRRDVAVLLVRQGMTAVALGAGVGLVAAGAASRLLDAVLFGVSGFDPPTYGGVVALLALVGLAAAAVPARRAAKLDPARALAEG